MKSLNLEDLQISKREKVFIGNAMLKGYQLEAYETESGKKRGIIRCYRADIETIRPNGWNPNQMEARTEAAIGESLAEFGQVLELIVRVHPDEPDAFEIIDGEHRFGQMSGIVSVHVLFGLSEAELKKMTIVLNETRGEADRVELAQLLSAIEQDLGQDTRTALPYSEVELDELLKLASVNWDNFSQGDYNNEGNSKGKSDGKKEDDDWAIIKIRMPKAVKELAQDAWNLIEQERGGLHKDKEIAWGVVLECLVAEYLAIPRSDPMP